MANTTPDVLEQMPASGNVSEPDSGTYGDVKQLEDLQAALPGEPAPDGGLPPAPDGGGSVRMPSPTPPTGLPEAIFAPSTEPDVPGWTLPQQPAPIAAGPAEQRIQMYEALSRDPNVSPATRRLAQRLLNGRLRNPDDRYQ